MTKKLTYEFVKQQFEERGYELLETEYVNANTKMAYICSRHRDKGVQYIKYGTLSQGSGCKYCGIEKRANTQSLDFETVKKAFEERGYQLLETEYINAQTKMAYICSKHQDEGVQTIIYNSLQQGHGCRYCGQEKVNDALKYTFEDVKRDFEAKGYELLETKYVDCHTKMAYICPKHRDRGVQYIRYYALRQGRGCKYCNESKGELRIAKFLDLNNIQYTREQKFEDCKYKKPLPFDFYLPQLNVIIEFDGEQHFRPVNFNGISNDKAKELFQKTQHRDNIKDLYCLKKEIHLIRIPYWDIDSIEEILKKELNIY